MFSHAKRKGYFTPWAKNKQKQPFVEKILAHCCPTIKPDF